VLRTIGDEALRNLQDHYSGGDDWADVVMQKLELAKTSD
jgi:hypothetical protein